MKMNRALLSLVALALLPASAVAAPPARERIESLLSHIERVPGREQLLSASPDAEKILQDIVQRPSTRMLARTRAIALLRYFPSPATSALLRELCRPAAASKAVGVAFLDFRAALGSYAVVAGPASIDVIQPLLAHSSMDVRLAAVRALAEVRSPRVLGLLEARRRVETAGTVRHFLEREVARLRAPAQR
jgi:hypothetical protein